jgi:hypothetical protein
MTKDLQIGAVRRSDEMRILKIGRFYEEQIGGMPGTRKTPESADRYWILTATGSPAKPGLGIKSPMYSAGN